MTTTGPSPVPWRKSSHSESGENQSNCVELAAAHRAVAVRDSKHPGGPVLRLSPTGFRSLLRGLQNI